MGHVLGQDLLSRQPKRQPVGGSPIASIQLVERVPFPLGETSMELQVIQIHVRHRSKL